MILYNIYIHCYQNIYDWKNLQIKSNSNHLMNWKDYSSINYKFGISTKQLQIQIQIDEKNNIIKHSFDIKCNQCVSVLSL